MSAKSDESSYYIRLLEAILFVAERPVSVEEIKQKLHLKEEKELDQLLSVVKQNLEGRRSFIEIVDAEEGQSVLMRIEPTIKRELDVFRTKKTMSKELMQTLSYIALKQPLKYTELRQMRGNKAKSHVEALEREGFIKVDPSGRTKVLTTTLYFASVFNLDPDNVKETFKEEVKKRMLTIIDK
ncbi:MAG: SMC-Scp complex subunit ScpB [Candidatus Helarchaeota archaeon]|nr:SMC-Scp complex subunit ScpB [Candidatus Helarchaeota archaeon]